MRVRLLACSVGMVACYLVIQAVVSLDTDTVQQLLLVTMLLMNTLYSSINAVFQVSVAH